MLVHEEEDEYDNEGGRRKKGVTDYVACSSSYKELSNHTAAKERLKEDAETAGSLDPLQVANNTTPAITDTHVNVSKKVANLKSILKRKDNQMDSKPKKRVRFDPKCKDGVEKSQGPTGTMIKTRPKKQSVISYKPYVIPDYVLDSTKIVQYSRDPTKFMHYIFDSEPSRQALKCSCVDMDRYGFSRSFNMLKNMGSRLDYDRPKSAMLTPGKKCDFATVKNSGKSYKNVVNESLNNKVLPIGIAAAEAVESRVFAVEKDGPEVVADKTNGSHRFGLTYYRRKEIQVHNIFPKSDGDNDESFYLEFVWGL